MPLHPTIVHFPPVLLLSAAVLYALGIIGKKPQMELIAFGFHVAGLLACILAIFTGDFDADFVATDIRLEPAISKHENIVTIATYAFGMLGIWAFLRQKTRFPLEKAAFLVAFVGLVVMLFVGAHFGGKLVYEEGVGVDKSIRQAPTSEAGSTVFNLLGTRTLSENHETFTF
jgi:uncharacterized membrane protein